MIDIEALARQCIAEDWTDPLPGYYRDMNLTRFAALVADECAKLAEHDDHYGNVTQHNIAAAIRSAFAVKEPT